MCSIFSVASVVLKRFLCLVFVRAPYARRATSVLDSSSDKFILFYIPKSDPVGIEH